MRSDMAVVDVAGGLVGQEDVGPVDHRAGDRQPLLLASREGRRHGVHAVAQAYLKGDAKVAKAATKARKTTAKF